MKKYILFILLFFGISMSNAQVSVSDSLALVALYNSTDGANWDNNTNWLQAGKPVSTWYRVTVSGGRVTEIDLQCNNLSGSLPSEIGSLVQMETLNLLVNNLEGSIPVQIGNLINLKYISLGFNNLTGIIPSQIGNLTQLDTVILCGNDLTGSIPEEISLLSNLKFLALGSNKLNGAIPAAIGNLNKLEALGLSLNSFSGTIPKELGNLSQLLELYVSCNKLTGSIPPEIGGLTNLTQLHLDYNELSGPLPAELGNLSECYALELDNNQFSGSVPAEICNLNKLVGLALNVNCFTGSLPSGLTTMPALIRLEVENNNFTFYDLEPIKNNAFTTFSYSPQYHIPNNTFELYKENGDDLNLDITNIAVPEVIAANNQYQWWKNGVAITSYGSSPELSLSSLDNTSEGNYHCTMTNSDFPLLTLTSNSVYLVMNAPTDITLSPSSIDENVPPGSLVGQFSTNDPDQTTGHTYNFVPGNGIDDADNHLFMLNGTELIIDTIPDFESKSQYKIRVRVTDNDLKYIEKAFTISINDLPETTGIETDEELSAAVVVYPNPAHDFLIVDIPDESFDFGIELYDVSGRLLLQNQNFYERKIDLRSYQTGMYFLHLKLGDKLVVKKIVIK